MTLINVPSHDEERGLRNAKEATGSSKNPKTGGGWGNDTSASADDSSEEFNHHEPWKVEVSKTVVQTHDTI